MSTVVELRQYALRPGRRDELIELFDREFVETQEAAGMAILGQFRDLDAPDRFVWLRGFPDMAHRAEALQRFYSGPVWQAHKHTANATMVDVDDVLLLRPGSPLGAGFAAGGTRPAGDAGPPASRVLVTIYYRDHPFDEAFADRFDRDIRPALAEAGATPLACLQTEYAENNFPALPVRTGEHVFVWLARFPGLAELDEHVHAQHVLPQLKLATQRLRLAPTARSALH
jgi:hypothetical protein